MVLDGPNGFGKTTIFDAVELVMTGKISRITNTIDRRLGYEYTLFSNNNEVDTEVRIEFEKGGEKIVIAKRIDSKKNYTQIQKDQIIGIFFKPTVCQSLCLHLMKVK